MSNVIYVDILLLINLLVNFLMLSAALAVGAWAVTGRAACSVTAPYQFPVQPGTPEWA